MSFAPGSSPGSLVDASVAPTISSARSSISPRAPGPIPHLWCCLWMAAGRASRDLATIRFLDGWRNERMKLEDTGVSVAIDEAVAIVTFSRPPLNYFDVALIEALADALEEIDRRPELRAVLLR